MTPEQKSRILGDFLSGRVESNQKRLADFSAKFASDPVYALSWSRDTFAHAADLRVAQECLAVWETAQEVGKDADAAIAAITAELTKSVMRGAKYVPSSTSQTSNLMDAEIVAASVRLLDDLKWSI